MHPPESGLPVSLSLAEAQKIAFERNWDLLAAAVSVDAATAQQIIAREFPNPTLAVSTTKISADSQPNSTVSGNGVWDRNYDTVVAINQLFEVGGKRRHRQASARAAFQQARAMFLDARRTLELAVAKAYIAAVQSRENVEVLLKSAKSLRQEATLAAIREKAGEISTADRGQIEITARRFELDAQTAEANAAQAQVALEVLLGATQPGAKFSLAEQLENLLPSGPVTTKADPLLRPDVLAAEAGMRKAESEVALQKAVRIPDPTLVGQYEHQPPDQPNTVGLGVSLPLPLWNRNRGNIRVAEASLEQARITFGKQRAQAAGEVASARYAYEAALEKWRSYRQEVAPKSEQVRRTLSYAYQKGAASLLDMLLAERNDNDVRLATAQAAADAASAFAVLKAATNEVSKQQLNE